MGGSDSQPSEDVVLGEYLTGIVRGWKTILVVTTLSVGAATLYTATAPRVYQATATAKLSAFEYSPYRDQSLAIEYLSSTKAPLETLDPADRATTRVSASPLSSSHIRVVARSGAPAAAVKAANAAAEHFVSLSNDRSPAPTPAATESVEKLRATRDAVEQRIASPAFLSKPPDERQADVVALSTLNGLAAQDQAARAENAANRLRAAEVIVPATPDPNPVSPSLKLNLAVAVGLGLLVSIGILSARSFLRQPER